MATFDPRDVYLGGYPTDRFDLSGFTAGTGLSTYGNTVELQLSESQEFQELKDRISAIEDQLLILRPDLEMQEKYPALKEAYDAYQLILKMVKDNSKTNK